MPLHCEVSAAYIARVIRKVRRDGYRACSPSRAAAADFNAWLERFFAGSVVAGECNSWFKLAGPRSRVVIGWPGSTRHRVETLAEPRWEDFEFETDHKSNNRARGYEHNRFGHWGDGNTVSDVDQDLAVLIRHLQKAGEVDFTRLHDSAYP